MRTWGIGSVCNGKVRLRACLTLNDTVSPQILKACLSEMLGSIFNIERSHVFYFFNLTPKKSIVCLFFASGIFQKDKDGYIMGTETDGLFS